MFHIQVAAAANLVRADPNHGPLPNKVEILRLKHQSRGLALVMAELKSLKGTASDGLLMAMVMVAMLTDPNQIPVPDTFRRSPLATAQNLHLYARLTVIPAMIEAMMGLVVKRGGIHNIKEYGMTQVLQLFVQTRLLSGRSANPTNSADLMLSSRLGIQPSFPWLYAPVRVLDLATYSPDQDAVLMSLVIATGFTQLDAVDLRLANLLREAGEVTVALDHYQQGRLNAPVLTDIVNAANSVQHRLLSMVPSSPLELHSNDFLRNMCRLAALIYSDLVLYPLPPSTEARPRLAKELSIAMEKFEVFKCEEVAQTDDPSDGDQYTNLVIWILMLGAFASTSTATSPFFINKLREYIARIPYLSDWPSFSNLMATYLWWEYIFAEPAAALWMEVCTFPQDPENSSSLFSGSYEQSQLSLGWSSNGPSIDAQDTDQTKHPGVSVQIISERSTLA